MVDLSLDALSCLNLFLAAIGLAITFGVMRVINMAHGEFIMMGASRLRAANHSESHFHHCGTPLLLHLAAGVI